MARRSTPTASAPRVGLEEARHPVAIGRVDLDDAGDRPHPNHHLWRNGRLWWIAFTVHHGHLQERVRFSLRTDDVFEARRQRDEIFATYEEARKCRISIRLKQPRSGNSASRRRGARGAAQK